MCGGSKGQSTSKQHSNTNSSYTPAGLQDLQQIWQQANQASQIPYVPYGGQLVAGFTPEQQAAQQNINSSVGMAQPYLNASAGLFGQAAQNPNTNGLVQSFYNPMAQNVMANLQEQFGQQMAQTSGQLQQAAGGVGADRIAVGQSELARQQGLAAGQTMAGLYGQALQAAQGQQGLEQASAFGFGQLGPAAQQAMLSGANAQLGIGTLGQQTQQNLLNANYQQFLRQQGYPFQTAQFLGSVGLPAATSMGGTGTGQSTGMATYTPAQPSPISQAVGLAELGAAFVKKGGRITRRDGGGFVGGTQFDYTGSAVPKTQPSQNTQYNPMAIMPMLQVSNPLTGANAMLGGNMAQNQADDPINLANSSNAFKRIQQNRQGWGDARQGWGNLFKKLQDSGEDVGDAPTTGWDATVDQAYRGGRFASGGSPWGGQAYLPNGGGIGGLQTVQAGPSHETLYAGQNGQFFEDPMKALSPAEQAAFQQQGQSNNNSNSNSNSSPQNSGPAPFVPSQSSVDIGSVSPSPFMGMGMGMMPWVMGAGSGGNQSTFDPTAGGTLSTNPSWLHNGMGAGHSGLPFATLARGGVPHYELGGAGPGPSDSDIELGDDRMPNSGLDMGIPDPAGEPGLIMSRGSMPLQVLQRQRSQLPPLRFGDNSMPPLGARAQQNAGLPPLRFGDHTMRPSGLVMSPPSQGDRPGLVMDRPPSAATNDMDWPDGGANGTWRSPQSSSPYAAGNPPRFRGIPVVRPPSAATNDMDWPRDHVIPRIPGEGRPSAATNDLDWPSNPKPQATAATNDLDWPSDRTAVHHAAMHAAPPPVRHADSDLEHAYLMGQISGRGPVLARGGIAGYDVGGDVKGDVQDVDPLTVDDKGNPIDPYARVDQILKNTGLSPWGAAGLTGRANVESGLNTKAVGDSGQARGMFQLHPDRQAGLQSWARQNDLDPTNRDVQTLYAAQEGKTSEQGPWQQMVNAQTPEQGVAGAMAFERPKGWEEGRPERGLGYQQTLADAKQINAGIQPDGLGAVGQQGVPSGGGYSGPSTDDIRNDLQRMRSLSENSLPFGMTPGRFGLAEMGLATLAGGSPWAAQNIGRGGFEGLEAARLAQNNALSNQGALLARELELRPKWGVIGQNEFGQPQYGMVSPLTGEVKPYGGTGSNSNDIVPQEAVENNIRGEDFLNKFVSPSLREQVRQVMEYRTPYNPNVGRQNIRQQRINALAAWANPDLGSYDYPAKLNLMKSFVGDGGGAQQIGAINTVAGHLGLMSDLAEAFHNGNVQDINKVINYVRTQLGHPEVVDYNTARTAIGNELERAWRKGVGSQTDIDEWKKQFDASANSPEQLRAVPGIINSLLQTKIGALKTEWDQGHWTGKDTWENRHFINKEASNSFGKLARRSSNGLNSAPDSLMGKHLQYKAGVDQYRDKDTGEVFDGNGNPVK